MTGHNRPRALWASRLGFILAAKARETGRFTWLAGWIALKMGAVAQKHIGHQGTKAPGKSK